MSQLMAAGVVAGAIVMIVTAAKVLTSWQPMLWLFRRLVVQPVDEVTTRVVRRECAAVVDDQVVPLLGELLGELRPNGGASMHDKILDRVESIDGRVGLLDERLTAVEARIGSDP